jgi:osmotically-inducible protein OsmY
LRWDKELADAKLEVYTGDADTIILRGTVGSASAKEKAIELAGDTIGVASVTDELQVQPPVVPDPAGL